MTPPRIRVKHKGFIGVLNIRVKIWSRQVNYMLDTELITYLSKLSKIDLSDEAKAKLVVEMSSIVDLMDTMQEVEIDDSINLNGEGMSMHDLREDEVVPSFNREELLKNSAHNKDGFFVVPRVVE